MWVAGPGNHSRRLAARSTRAEGSLTGRGCWEDSPGANLRRTSSHEQAGISRIAPSRGEVSGPAPVVPRLRAEVGGADGARGHAGVLPRRGLDALRRARPRLHRRSLRALRRQRRPRAPRNRRGHGRAGGTPRLHRGIHLQQRPGGRTRRDGRPARARRPFPGLFRFGGLGGHRNGPEDRQAGPGDARLPEALQGHRAARLLPRHDHGRAEPDGITRRELPRPLHVRGQPRPLAQPLPQRLRSRRRGRRHHVRALRGAGDHQPGTGNRGRRDRRAGVHVQREPRPLARLLEDAARDLRQARRLPDHGRGDQRLRTHRQDVRQRGISGWCPT